MNLRRMCILLLLDGVSWIFIGRTYAEIEAPTLWPLDGKSWLIRKDRDAGKDWKQEEKGMTEDEMVGWHHWLNGYEFEQLLGDGKPGMLQFMGLKRVRHDRETKQQQFYNCNLDPVDWWCCSIQLNPYWFSACWICQLLIE